MKQAALSHFDMTWLPITGLVIFVVSFSLYTYWTFHKSNREHYREASLIPIEDTEGEET
jgi:cbb3-type cytochrome oxidase subunit 3